jgi:hypothetical protein
MKKFSDFFMPSFLLMAVFPCDELQFLVKSTARNIHTGVVIGIGLETAHGAAKRFTFTLSVEKMI